MGAQGRMEIVIVAVSPCLVCMNRTKQAEKRTRCHMSFYA